MNNNIYAWDPDSKKVITVTWKSRVNDDFAVTKRLYAVDCSFFSDEGRYGSYLFSENNLLIGCWETINFSLLPAEFKAHLLLLGITS